MTSDLKAKKLPAGWERVRLGDACAINPRRPAKLAIEPDAKTTFVPMAGVDGKIGAITQHFRGAVGQQRVPKEFLIDLEIPLPPLADQRRIVARLNAQMEVVERAKAAAREILEAADALNAAIVRELMP